MRMASGPNWSKAKHRSGTRVVTSSIRSSLVSLFGSVDSFQVRVRCNEIARSPISLNEWMTSRTVSSCAATSRAIAGTGGAGRRRHDDQRAADPDRAVLAASHDLL